MLTAYTYTDYTEQGMVLIARAIFLSERGQTNTNTTENINHADCLCRAARVVGLKVLETYDIRYEKLF